MIKTYLKVAVRQLLRNKFYSLLNIIGLSIGLAACLLIFLYVQQEMSYDQFHANKDRIYRISEVFKTGDGTMETALTAGKLSEDLDRHFEEIQNTALIDYDIERYIVKSEEKRFTEEKVSATASSFFSVFSFPLLQGDPATVLDRPYTVAISDQMARKYFQDEPAIGKVMEFIDPYDYRSFEAQVTGVFESMPDNSHFHKDFFLSAKTAEQLIPERKEQLGWTSHFSYLLLAPGTDVVKLEKQINDYIFSHYPKEVVSFWSGFHLQSLNDIHLRSNLKEELEANGDMSGIYIFSAIGLFIILLAGINYMNLATSRAVSRAKEVGVRKVGGALRGDLVLQFLTESLVITLISFVIAAGIAVLSLPLFNSLTGKSLRIDLVGPGFLIAAIAFTLIIGVIAGSYPAMILSRFKPVSVIKGGFARTGRNSLLFRRGLVVLQFAVSIMLIIGTIIIQQQRKYLQTKKLGIASGNVLVIKTSTSKLQSEYATLKEELKRNPAIVGVTASRKNITSRFSNFTALTLANNGEKRTMPWTSVDGDFFNTFEVPLVAGNDFPVYNANDSLTNFIINESAAQMLGIKDPVGQPVSAIGRKGRIIGVIKDFNFESLHTPVSPVLFMQAQKGFPYISVRLKGDQLTESINFIQSEFRSVDADAAFDYSFLDDNIAALYQQESTFLKAFKVFSTLAILIACLGIIGLTTFTATQRRKEIGIRKVLGASVRNVSFLLTREFISLVLLANLIAWPVAYYFMARWLNAFPYRVDIALWMFLMAALIALAVAVCTVCIQTIKAAMANPVKALKSE